MRRDQYPRVFGCPQIESDEALSSWVMAVAAVTREHVRELYNLWNLHIEGNLYEIDVRPESLPFAAMASAAMVPVSSIQAATRMFRTVLSRPEYRCLTRRSNGKPMHRYCPSCLLEGPRPYVRAVWRLAYWSVCERHGRRLLDRCPECLGVINCSNYLRIKHRKDVVRILACCPECGHDLRRAPLVQAPESLLTALTQAQRRIHRLITSPVQRFQVGTISSSSVLELFLVRGGGTRERPNFVGINWARLLENYHGSDELVYPGSGLSELEWLREPQE